MSKSKHIGTPQFQPMSRTVKQLARSMVNQRQQQHKRQTERLTTEVLAAVKAWHEARDMAEVVQTFNTEQALQKAWEALEAHVIGGIWNE